MTHEVPVAGGPLTPLALRQIARWLDIGEKAFHALARIKGDALDLGHDVQDDLLRWADELEQGRLVTALTGPTEPDDV